MTREAMQAVYGWARTSGPGSEGAPLFLLGDSAGRWADFATYVPLYASPSAAAQADASMLWLAHVREDFRRMADEANGMLAGHASSVGEAQADAKDAARFQWYFSDKPKGDWICTYLDGVRTGWTTDQWRAAIDAAMHSEGGKP